MSEGDVDKVRLYIQNQYGQHGDRPFKDVYKMFIEKYGFVVKG